MRFIYIPLALILGMVLSAYHQYHKPQTLYQYHRYEPRNTSKAFCAVTCASSVINEKAIKGKELFKYNCAQCHNRNMRHDLTGPALHGVEKRWAVYPKKDLYQWVRNSQSLVEANHPKAVEIYNEWDKTLMNDFPNLTDEDIESLLAYIELY